MPWPGRRPRSAGLRLLTDSESRLLELLEPRAQRRPAATGRTRRSPALFAAQVAGEPGRDGAGLRRATRMTYAELDRRSNALAWLLRRRGVSADMPVGVAIERGPDLVAALLAVLKAGGAYLPIDIGSPAPRVAAMIAAARCPARAGRPPQTAAAMPRLAGVGMVRVDTEHRPGRRRARCAAGRRASAEPGLHQLHLRLDRRAQGRRRAAARASSGSSAIRRSPRLARASGCSTWPRSRSTRPRWRSGARC